MAAVTFFAGTIFGAIVLSTIPTTGKLIAEISPYFRIAAEFIYPYAIQGFELVLEQLK